MWVIEGPFDEVEDGRTKKKVLYPGQSYPLGRGSEVLFLPQRTISTEQAVITVGKHPASDAADLDAIPTLTYTQNKKVAIIVRTKGDPVQVPAQSTVPIKPNDNVYVIGGVIFVTFTWVPVNVLVRSGLSRDERTPVTASLAQIGIKSSFRVHNPFITHVVFSNIPPPPLTDLKILIPLVSGLHFVSPAWLSHVASRGRMDPEDESTLISEYDELEEEKFRPDGAGLSAWKPDARRNQLFQGVQFHLLTSTEPPPDIETLLTTASGGSLVTHIIDPTSSETYEQWERKLASLRRKAEKQANAPSGLESPFVLIGDAELLHKELGEEKWEGVYRNAMNSLGIRMIWLPEIADAILKLDVALISSSSPSAPSAAPVERQPDLQPLPPFIPSTHPSEPSIQPSVPRSNSGEEPVAGPSKLTRRSTRRPTPAPAPAAEVEEIGVRRSSRRSVSVAPILAGAVEQDVQPPAEAREPHQESEQPPEPELKKTILKRRVTRRAPSSEPVNLPPPRAPHVVIETGDPATSISQDFDEDRVSSLPSLAVPVRSLKRRVTGRQKDAGTQSLLGEASMDVDTDPDIVEIEPPHQKYKALFEGTQMPLESVEEEGEESNAATGNAATASLKRKADGTDVDSGERVGTTSQSKKRLKQSEPSSGSGPRPGTSTATQTNGQATGFSIKSQLPASADGIGSSSADQSQSQGQSGPSASTSASGPRQTTQTQTQAQTLARGKKKVQVVDPPQADAEHQPTTDPVLQQLLKTKSKKTGATAGLDKEFSHLRLTAHPAERLKLEEEERQRREMEVWKELQEKEKEDGFEGENAVRGNFMVIVTKDDLIVPKDARVRRGQLEVDGAVPNFKKFRKKNIAAFRGPKIELELPPPVDYGLGDAYWQKDRPGNVTLGADAVNPLAVGSKYHSQAVGEDGVKGGPGVTKPHSTQPTSEAPHPKRKKQLQLRVHSSSEEEEVRPVTGKTKTKGKAKAPPKKIDLHFSEDEDEDEQPQNRKGRRADLEEESEIFDMNVSGPDEEDDDDFTSTGRTIKSTGRSTTSKGTSQRSTAAAKTNGTKRKAALMDLIPEDDEDDEDDMAFKGFGKKAKKVKR